MRNDMESKAEGGRRKAEGPGSACGKAEGGWRKAEGFRPDSGKAFIYFQF